MTGTTGLVELSVIEPFAGVNDAVPRRPLPGPGACRRVAAGATTIG
jgi:hypothetical protein